MATKHSRAKDKAKKAGLHVIVRDSLDKSLADFKRNIERAGVLSDVMHRMEYEQPSKTRRRTKLRKLKTINKAREEFLKREEKILKYGVIK